MKQNKWKGWQKKMIWFFGISLLDLLGDWVYFKIYNVPSPMDSTLAMFYLALFIIPLFFLKDD